MHIFLPYILEDRVKTVNCQNAQHRKGEFWQKSLRTEKYRVIASADAVVTWNPVTGGNNAGQVLWKQL